MPRITKVYTRGGDDGTTALGSRQRVAKNSARIEAYGSVDELSSQIGVAMAADLSRRLWEPLKRIQNELFHLGSDLCVPEEDKASMPVPQIEAHHVGALETLMDDLSEQLEPLANFVLPGGCPAAAHLHVARTVCRRAERRLVTLGDTEPIGSETVRYLNRLSDALFVMARYANFEAKEPEIYWDSRA